MAVAHEGNSSKPSDYYGHARVDLIDILPRPLGRVLDLGCGRGGGHAALRAGGATHLTGVELMPEQASRAAEVYDRVEVGDAAAIVLELDGPFDTILCYDVLEHLVDPVSVMRRLRELAAPGANLQVSIPNARYIALIFDLLFRGTFGYTEFGHRDNTHLRWFTRKDMLRTLAETGWTPDSDRPAYTRFSTIRRPLDAMTGGTVSELVSLQWYYLAHAA